MRSPPRQARSVAALALLLLVAACATAPPPARVEGEAAVVRAATAAEAVRVARLVEEIEPRISAMLPDAVRSPIEVWVEGELDPPEGRSSHGVAAYTATTTRTDTGERSSVIHIPRAAALDRAVLAHEIVHARLGRSWRRLPDFLVEGVCEYAASRVAPEFGRSAGRRHLALAALAVQVPLVIECAPGIGAESTVALTPRLSRRTAFADLYGADLGRTGQARDWEEERIAYAFGYLLVSAIADRSGLNAAHDLCRRAEAAGRSRADSAWILEAADLPEDGSLGDWVLARLDEDCLEEIATIVAPAISKILLSDFRADRLAPDADSYLARAAPRLRGGAAEIRLGSVTALRRALRDRWPD